MCRRDRFICQAVERIPDFLLLRLDIHSSLDCDLLTLAPFSTPPAAVVQDVYKRQALSQQIGVERLEGRPDILFTQDDLVKELFGFRALAVQGLRVAAEYLPVLRVRKDVYKRQAPSWGPGRAPTGRGRPLRRKAP